MIKKHEYNDVIGKFSEDDLRDVVTDVMRCCDNCINIIKHVEEFADDYIDEFDLMDELEENLMTNLDKFSKYARFSCSTYPAINSCLAKNVVDVDTEDNEVVLSNISYLNNQIETIVNNASGVLPEEAQALKEMAGEIIGALIYVLRYDFLAEETYKSLEQNNHNEVDADVDSAVYQWCTKSNTTVTKFVEQVMALAKEYKPHLPVLDDHPELAEPFEDCMGPWLADIDTEALTLEIVLKVLKGEVPPEEVYRLFSESEEE